MTTFRIQPSSSDGAGDWDPRREAMADPSAVLGAVREDIRQTLRVGWIDPSLDAVAAQPVFFTAAWSAIRPNVGKSFQLLARSLRAEALETVISAMDLLDLRKRLASSLSEEELIRIEACVKAAQIATVKVQIVVHAFYRAIRRDRVRSTGREEAPVRRGVPDWQRWMSFQPASPSAQAILDRAGHAFGLVGPPTPLRLLARWPGALEAAWSELDRHRRTENWQAGASRLRRALLGGIQTLPHPIELQWPALKARGFLEADRAEITRLLAAHDAAMPGQSLAAAFLWQAFGAPEIGSEA
jgi:hypothetical protein